MLAVLPTLIAVLAGVALGLSSGGRMQNLLAWRPVAWKLAVGGIAVQLLFKLLPFSGGLAVVLDIVSMAALLAFAVLNIRVGGMVVVVVGLALNLLPTLVDFGTPVSPNALVSSGLVSRAALGQANLEGPRHLEDGGDSVAWLGEVIALPTHQVISLGDLVLLLGEMLVVSALLRNRHVDRAPPPPQRAQRRDGPKRRPPGGPAPPAPQAKGTGRMSYEEAMARLEQGGGPSKGAGPVRRPRHRDEQVIDLRDPVTRDRRS